MLIIKKQTRRGEQNRDKDAISVDRSDNVSARFVVDYGVGNNNLYEGAVCKEG